MIRPIGFAILIGIGLFQIVGVALLWRIYRQHVRFFESAQVADGVVVGTRRFSAGEGPDYFARVFYRVSGTEYQLEGGIWTASRRYKRGQKVKVYFQPEAPEAGRIGDRALPFICIGGALLISLAFAMNVWGLISYLKNGS